MCKRICSIFIIFVLTVILGTGCGSTKETVDDSDFAKQQDNTDRTQEKVSSISLDTQYDDNPEDNSVEQTQYRRTAVSEVKIGDTPVQEFTITLSDHVSATEQFAAQELQYYVEEATGVCLQYTSLEESSEHQIIIETSQEEDLSEDGFLIMMEEGSLKIIGGTGRGALYGTYQFLDDYIQCRWFTPEYETIVRTNSVIVPETVYQKEVPIFEVRQMDLYTVNKDDFYRTRCKLNYGMRPDALGGGIFSSTDNFYTYEDIIPSGIYLKSNPEYYSKNDELQGEQLCLTNPEVILITEQFIRNLLQENSDLKLISIALNDNGSYCQCDNCRAVIEDEGGNPSGLLICFVNQIVQDISADYPDVCIEVLVSGYTAKAPEKTRPLEKVRVCFSTQGCCSLHAINDVTCEINQEFYHNLIGWTEICDNMSIMENISWSENSNAYFPDLWTIKENTELYADLNIKGCYLIGNDSGKSADFTELKTYLFSKLLWNPYLTDELYEYNINEFLEYYYGDGWSSIRDYLDLVSKKSDGLHCSDQSDCISYIKDDLEIENIEQLWEMARDAASPMQLDRIEKAYTSVLTEFESYYISKSDESEEYSQKAILIQHQIEEYETTFNLSN